MGNAQNPATGDLDQNGYRVRHLPQAAADDEPLRRDQVSASVLLALLNAYMLRRDGLNAASADIPFASHTLTGIRDAVAAQEPVSKAQLDAAIASIPSLVTKAEVMDLINNPWSTGSSLWEYNAGAPETWTVPAGVTWLRITMTAGGGAGGAGAPGSGSYGGKGGGGGASGGQVRFRVKVNPGDTLTRTIGRGGQTSAATGADTVLTLPLCSARVYGGNGGVDGSGRTGGGTGGPAPMPALLMGAGPYVIESEEVQYGGNGGNGGGSLFSSVHADNGAPGIGINAGSGGIGGAYERIGGGGGGGGGLSPWPRVPVAPAGGAGGNFPGPGADGLHGGGGGGASGSYYDSGGSYLGGKGGNGWMLVEW